MTFGGLRLVTYWMNSKDNQAYNTFLARQASKIILAQRCSHNTITTQGKVSGQIKVIYEHWGPVVTPNGFYLLCPELDTTSLSVKWVSALKKLAITGITREAAIERLRPILDERISNGAPPLRGRPIDSWYQVDSQDLILLTRQCTEESRSEFLCL